MNTYITTSKLLAHTLREYRYRAGLSQADIARIANVKQSTISAFENHPDATKIETFFKILFALELELSVQPRPNQNNKYATQDPNTINNEDW